MNRCTSSFAILAFGTFCTNGGAFDHLFSARQERRVSWWRWLHLAEGQRVCL